MYVLNKSSSWNNRKATRVSNDDVYPLDTVATTARVNADSDLENQVEAWQPGDIVVKRDVYVHSAPTKPAAGPV
ncbi:hypothetical protein PT974_07703 [Cladobotryum mycophilum]|uniref:Uncharacterized protein n=1 Tax=Cladobotryum mycophilum TaxID=491253 RepID=A0ABR0SIU2_9HYPO